MGVVSQQPLLRDEPQGHQNDDRTIVIVVVIAMLWISLIISLDTIGKWLWPIDALVGSWPERREHLKWLPRFGTDRSYLPDTWFEIVAFISRSEDVLQTSLHGSPWLREFIPLPDQEIMDAVHSESSAFPKSRAAFDLDPDGFISSLEKTSKELRVRELSESVVMFCGAPDIAELPDNHRGWLVKRKHGRIMRTMPAKQRREEQKQRIECWLRFQSRLLEVIESTKPSNDYTTSRSDAGQETLKDIVASDATGISETALNQCRDFLGRQRFTYDDPERAIARSWRPERRRRFAEICKSWDKDSLPILELLLLWLQECVKSQDPLSVILHQFQLKTIEFVETLTGRSPSSYRDALRSLRALGSRKTNQHKVLYDAIVTQRSQLDQQQQIITCLEYRHVLEKLPVKSSNDFQNHPDYPKNGKQPSATKAWHITWDLAVRAELSKMIQEYNNPRAAVVPKITSASMAAPGPSTAAGSSAPPVPAPSTSAVSQDSPTLEQCLRYDFDFHADRWAQKAKGKGKVPQPSSVLTIADIEPNLENWPSYTSGKSLYGDLSTNIHSFGRSFEIHRINWLKGQFDLLKWLKPTDAAPASSEDPAVEEAFWKKQWTDRNLPL